MGFFSNLFSRKPQTCKVCGVETKELMTVNDTVEEYYCRQHLLEVFKSIFIGSPYRMVVCAPNFSESTLQSMYSYYPIDRMKTFSFTPQAQEKIKECLAETQNKKCQVCGRAVQSVYFDTVLMDGSGPVLEKLEITQGLNLCHIHTFDRIKDALMTNPGLFKEYGLGTPYSGDGVYVSTHL